MHPGRRKLFQNHPSVPALVILAATGLVIAACSDLGDRVNRARGLADAAGDQITGEAVIGADADALLAAASVEDRAFGGGMLLTPVAFDPNAQLAAPLFAVGSILAKPIDIPEPPAAAIIEEDTYYIEDPTALEDLPDDQVAVSVDDMPEPVAGSAPAPPAPPVSSAVIESLPEIELDPNARDKTLREIRRAETDMKERVEKEPMAIKRTRSIRPREFKPIDDGNEQSVKRLARRSVLTQEAVTAQLDANQLMLNVLDKYDMTGSVVPSRNGQMVIQLGLEGAAPTQFTQEQVANAPAAFLAVEKAGGCAAPDNIEKVQKDAALATECVIAELKETGQFEYVEKDYIFANQFFKKPKPPEPQPGTTPNGNTSTPANPGTTTPKPPVTPAGPVTPNDPLWALQWHFRNNGSAAGESAGGAGFQDFWSRQATKGSADVVVAVVDTGLQMQHPDIKNSPNLAPGWDMVTALNMANDGDGRDADPNDPGDLCTEVYGPTAEDSFHGTHVAGTIGAAATDNGSGVAGGAWQVKIVPVRALGKCGGRLSDINDAIRWAAGDIAAIDPATGAEVWNANPADIINLSIGLFGACPASMQDAINQVTAKGVIVVSAAGNARMATGLYAPGGCANVISVAAGDARGQIAPYSNFGPEVDLLAPGGDLTRDDNLDTRPDGVLSTKAAKNCVDPVTGESVGACFYAYEQGTSMAAPHVSAALALIMAKSPSATSDEIVATLLAASDTRSDLQCSGLCSQYPGAEPVPGSPDMCRRPCGRMLNLARVPTAASGGGGRAR